MSLVSLRKVTVFCALALAETPLQPTAAQSAPAATISAATQVARPADVASEDAVIKAVYEEAA